MAHEEITLKLNYTTKDFIRQLMWKILSLKGKSSNKETWETG